MDIKVPTPINVPIKTMQIPQPIMQETIQEIKQEIAKEVVIDFQNESWAQPLDPNKPIAVPPLAQQACTSKIGHEVTMFNKIMEFERDAYNPCKKGFKTGFKMLDDGLEGLQTGFHMIAGDSNHGKSGFMSQLAWNVSQLNDDCYVMDFSLDDPLRDKLPRVVGCANKVLINAIRDPIRYSQYPEMIKRRNDGMQKLVDSIDRYHAYDASFSCNIEKIEEEIRRVKIELATNGINKRVCIFIDNFHDLDSENPQSRGTDKQKYDYLAQKVSDMATELDCPIVCTGEFRKLNGNRRPGVDDIRESVKIKYEAKSILLVYNEVSAKGEAAQIFYQLNGKPEKQPVFEVKFGKNKYSSFKGRGFCKFFPQMAFFEEATPDDTKYWNNLLYSGGN